MEGTVGISIEDRFGKGAARYRYSLMTPTGAVEIILSNPDAGKRVPSGSIVKVKGYRTSGKFLVPSGSSELDPEGVTTLQAAQAATPFGTTGARNVLVILMNFQDDQSTPVDVPTARSVVLDLVNRYYMEASYGQLSLTGDVTGYITLPTSEACGVYDKVLKYGIPMISAKFDLSKYQNLLFIGPGPKDCGIGGGSSIGDEPTIGAGLSVVQLNNLEASTVAHELGHTLGLHHANALDCGNISYDPTAACKNIEYEDYFDVMGRGSAGEIMPTAFYHFNSVLKEVLGWLTAIPGTTTGVYKLDPIEARESAKALKVAPLQRSESFYIEYRQPIGFDSFPFTAMYVREANGPRILLGGNPSHLLDMHSPSFTQGHGERAPLKTGERYIDYAKRFSITAVSTTTSAQMRVLIAPPNSPTAIFMNPSNNTVLTGVSSVSVDALDQSGIAEVELYRDGTLLGMQAAEPYSFTWYTSQEASGPHVLTAKAYNRSQATFSANINVTVRRPPKVSVTSPADNLVLTTVGDISLTATATADGASIQKVEFFRNDISLGAGTPAS